MAVHTAACVLSLIESEAAARWERLKTADVWTCSFAGLLHQHALGGDPVWRADSTIFYTLSILLIPPEVFPPPSSSSGRVWDAWRTTNERLPYHHSRISRLCELYCDRYSHTCHSHACARTCIQINSLRRLLFLQTAAAKTAVWNLDLSPSSSSGFLASATPPHGRLPRASSSLFCGILSHAFASVCTACLPGTFSSKEKWCFYFYFHLPFLQSSLFFERGIFFCPPTCKNSVPPPSTPATTAPSIRQQAGFTDSCLISHKLVLPLTYFLFCFLLLLIPFSTCPLPPSTSPWSSHFIFLPTNATQQSLKKCHFCLLLLFCNFFMSLLFSGEFIYRWLFFCPQLSDLSVSVFLSMSVSPSLSLTLCCSISFLPSRSFSFLHTIEKCHINVDRKWCIIDALLY